MAQTENDQGWEWHDRCRAIISKPIELLSLPNQARILEIGAGLGASLEMLRYSGELSASELDDFSRDIRFIRRHSGPKSPVPDLLPFQTKHFDPIFLFGVLEHVEADVGVLRVIRPFLKPREYVLAIVPSHHRLF